MSMNYLKKVLIIVVAALSLNGCKKDEGTAITAELKVKGKVIKPGIDSEHSTAYNVKSAKEWEYIVS